MVRTSLQCEKVLEIAQLFTTDELLTKAPAGVYKRVTNTVSYDRALVFCGDATETTTVLYVQTCQYNYMPCFLNSRYWSDNTRWELVNEKIIITIQNCQ